MVKPLTDKPLTIKQRKFLRALIRTGEPTEAAFQAYDCKNRKIASVIASQNLCKLNIQFLDLIERMGLTNEEDVADLKRLRKAKRLHACDVMIHDENGQLKVNKNSNDWIEVDDNQSQLKALELTLKLKGHLKEKVEHSGTVAVTPQIILIRYSASSPTSDNRIASLADASDA